jgi:uncharacterized membrane protein YfcA
VTVARAIVLVLAGIGGGLTGSIAGLASLATYPVLLAVGLAPVTANVTNSVALVFSSVGSVLGSRPELRGQADRVRQFAFAGVAGGAAGGALLLVTSSDSFELIVPWLIALAAVAMLLRGRLVDVDNAEAHRSGPGLLAAVAAVGVYAGYFGAGAGVMLLALLLHAVRDTMPRSNAVKNVVLGLGNGIAAVAFVIFGDVRWAYVAPLGAGLLIGGSIGPMVVRRSPVRPLRIVIGVAGLGLAVKLGFDAYA